MTKEQIINALKAVKDPQTGRDIVSVGRVNDINVEGNKVNITLALPTSIHALDKSTLNFGCMQAVQELDAAAEVNIHVVAQQTTEATGKQSPLPQVKNIIAVASGKGGVGKSTVSVNLALGLQQAGYKVGLMDADLYGPSIPTMLGLQGQRPQVKEVYGKPRLMPLEAYGLSVMSIGFIVEPEQAVVLRGPRLGGIIKQFVHDCIWPEMDFLIIDLPPGTGDVQLTLVQTLPLTGVALVTTPQEVAVIDAVKAMNMFLLPSVNVPILGVVENMAWFTPAELPDNKYYLFGQGGGQKIAEASESRLLGQIPIVQGIREGGDTGKPAILADNELVTKAFQKAVKNLEAAVAIRNETQRQTAIVETKKL